ncbi:hypothetical protein [Nitrosomonas sp. Nm166]|uniref:hypothetical protein n=1 Tax=Nitrosomonas sp. Nm166 TaxID=1881054 RepID=UPI0008E73CAD|nr:hypothetical protein [Nitrosomonas sp. Nm166]SFE83668.1 hypothetical protein SAMN05428977_10323 [Nitrosomonas sp. Nm166]
MGFLRKISAPIQFFDLKIIMVGVFIFSLTPSVNADTWRGTAPFCEGRCLPGEAQIATSNFGDGAPCWTGYKVLCRNSEPTCNAAQTNTSCYGIIQVCDNGSYEYTGAWRSCSTYICGACFGFNW